MNEYLIIGAGPAGMSAALEAIRSGIRPMVVDNRPEPGGNIYAWAESNRRLRPHRMALFGPDYRKGVDLVSTFLSAVSAGKINYHTSTRLWRLEAEGGFSITGPQGTMSGRAENVLLATGAQERPMPLPGWTLPGVMGVGAAQLLMKSGGDLREGPIAIVGNGPLPLLVLDQLRRAGRPVSAFVVPAGSSAPFAAAKFLPDAFSIPSMAIKGVRLLLRQMVARTRTWREATGIEILGKDSASTLRFKASSRWVEIPVTTVLLHDGIVPNLNPLAGAGLDLSFSAQQATWHAQPKGNLQVAGDAAGILGAEAAVLSGRIAALEALGQPVPADLSRRLARQVAFRRFVDAAYPPILSCRGTADETIICRCESVRAGALRAATSAADGDPNRLKRTLRAGMGPCQGRMCSHSIASIVAEQQRRSEGDIGIPRIRSPYLPVTFNDLTPKGLSEKGERG